MKKVLSRFLTFGLSAAMLCGLVTVSHAQSPSVAVDASAAESTYTGTYYNGITADSGTQLLGQVHDLIVSTHTTYTSYSSLATRLTISDPALNGENGIVEFYTHETISTYINDSSAKSGTWNKEHVWPQSLSGPDKNNTLWGTGQGAGSDMHHIRPSEQKMNGTRGNMKFGNVTNGSPVYSQTTSGSNSKIGGSSSGGVFMPLDNVKGDAARIVMYVYTHYNKGANVGGTKDSTGSGTLKFNYVMSGSEDSAIQTLLEWNELDPVDDIEIKRNEAVYKIQGNRNPFIDHPEYAEAIWGDGTYTPNPDSGDGGGTQGGGSTTPSTDAFQPITSPVAGTEYYLGMKTYDGAYHYLTGNMATGKAQYYMATTTNIAEATKVTLAGDNTNGWTLKCANGKYVEIELSGTHVNAVYVTASRGTWKWNTEKSLFVWETGGNTYYLGTHGTLTTVGGSDIAKYPVEGAEQWKVVLGTYGTQQGGTEPGGGGSQGGTEPGGGGGTVTPPAGGNGKITITLDSFDLTDSYGFKTWSASGVEGIAFIYGGDARYPDSAPTSMQFNKNKDSYYLASTTAVPGVITSVKVTGAGTSERDWKLLTSTTAYGEVAGKPTNGNDQGTKTVTTSGVTWNVSGNDTYFALTYELDKDSGAGYLASIEITYATGGSQGGGSTEPGGGSQGGTEPGGTHTHSFEYEVFDEEYHLKSCTGCDDVEDVPEAHVYSDDNDTTCDLCGYERTIEQKPSVDPGTGNTPSEDPGTGNTPSGNPGTGDTPSDTPATPSDSNESQKKSGCGGVIGGVGIAAVLVIAAAALCIVIVEKKRQ